VEKPGLELRVVYDDLPDMIGLQARVRCGDWTARSRAYASPDFLAADAERLVAWARDPNGVFRLSAGADTGIGWLVLDFYVVDAAGHARCGVTLATAAPRGARPAETWRVSIEMTTELGLIERFARECLSLGRDHSIVARLAGVNA
jgi:hypothetical protein